MDRPPWPDGRPDRVRGWRRLLRPWLCSRDVSVVVSHTMAPRIMLLVSLPPLTRHSHIRDGNARPEGGGRLALGVSCRLITARAAARIAARFGQLRSRRSAWEPAARGINEERATQARPSRAELCDRRLPRSQARGRRVTRYRLPAGRVVDQLAPIPSMDPSRRSAARRTRAHGFFGPGLNHHRRDDPPYSSTATPRTWENRTSTRLDHTEPNDP